MKKIVFWLSLSSLVACNSETSNDPCKSGTALPALALGDNKEAKILTANYWVVEFYVSPDHFEERKGKRGQWYKFNKDGTFINGHWNDKMGCGGTWRLDYSTQYPIILVDSYNDAEDCGWQLQAMTPDQSEMSWVGTEGYPNHLDMVKAISLLTVPTRKQFGDE